MRGTDRRREDCNHGRVKKSSAIWTRLEGQGWLGFHVTMSFFATEKCSYKKKGKKKNSLLSLMYISLTLKFTSKPNWGSFQTKFHTDIGKCCLRNRQLSAERQSHVLRESLFFIYALSDCFASFSQDHGYSWSINTAPIKVTDVFLKHFLQN